LEVDNILGKKNNWNLEHVSYLIHQDLCMPQLKKEAFHLS